MGSIIHRRFTGLSTDVNPNMANQESGLSEALNCVIRRRGIVEPRPTMVPYTADSNEGTPENTALYRGELVCLNESKLWKFKTSGTTEVDDQFSSASLLGYDGWSSMHAARDNLYVASQLGLRKMTVPGATSALRAGVAHYADVLTASANVSSNTDENWLPNNESAAYRIVLRTTDTNGVIVRSSPSTPYFVTNTGAAGRVTVTVYIRDNASLSNTYIELYRTRKTAAASPSASFYLVMEHPVTVGVTTAGSVALYDTKPDAELGRALYSNPSQLGYEFNPPRKGKALGEFAGSLFNGNLTSPQHRFIDFKITAPNNSSVTANMTFGSGATSLTLNSQVANYNGAVFVEGMLLYDATYFPSGTLVTNVSGPTITVSIPSATNGTGVTIEAYDTIAITDGTTTETYLAYFAVYNINTNVSSGFGPITTGPSGLVNARWYKGYNSAAGLSDYSFYMEELPSTQATLQLKATNAVVRYNDPPNEYSAGFGDFDVDITPGLMEWSALDQPEHFATGFQQAFVGDPDLPILAFASAKDRMYIFKEDGVWVLTGSSARANDFRLEKLSNHQLISPRHVCVDYRDHVYAWTNQGVIRITSSNGVVNISDQRVDNKLPRGLIPTDYPAGNLLFDPVAREVHCVCSEPGFITHLVYNTTTDAWVEWDVSETGNGAQIAVLTDEEESPLGIGFIGHEDDSAEDVLRAQAVSTTWGPTNYVVSAYGTVRGSFLTTSTATDQGDGTWVLVFTGSHGLVQGAVLNNGGFPATQGVVLEVTNSTTVVLWAPDGWSANTSVAVVESPYTVRVRTRPQCGEHPGRVKLWDRVTWKLERNMTLGLPAIKVGSLRNDASGPGDQSVGLRIPTYGNNSGAATQAGAVPMLHVNRNHAMNLDLEAEFYVAEAGAYWQLSVVMMEYEDISDEYYRYG